MDFETMILRFRDLVTSENGTIEQHKEIIAEYGYVWWAWWKKGGEKTPKEFALLDAQAKECPIQVFLVDSGQKLLYRATCELIESRPSTKIHSPEREKTPKYYCDQEYFAWFKFTKIESCETSELKQYSYTDCNDFFDDENINFSPFDNKRIYSVSELVQQNRTVWFIRKAKEPDPDNEIVLLNTDRIAPSNFSKKYYQSSGDTLLWLSDLHLSDRLFPSKAEPSRQTLTQHICSLITETDLAGLLISGDITSRAEDDGFQLAKELLVDLNNEVSAQLNSENIVVCPGNHDFKDFKREPSNLAPGANPAFVSNNGEATKGFVDFYRSIYNLQPNCFFASGKKILLSTGHILEIVALNSLMLQQYPNFEGHGYLSQEQLDFAAKEMGWDNNKNQNAIRIIMMHHHYLPACYVEFMDINKASSVVYDADRLMNWLAKYNVKVLLHGHKHRSLVAQVSYPLNPGQGSMTNYEFHQITVLGMGGTAAKEVENKFATITFTNDELWLQFYQLYSDQSSPDSLCQTVKIKL